MVSASPRKREPTIHEVARVAGVSHATVSRVLNGARYVSPTAQRAVEDAIHATGYIPNRQARSLVTRQTGSVVAVITEFRTPLPRESDSLQILRGCVRALALHEMSVEVVFVGTEEGKAQQRQLDRHIAGRRVQGVLLIPHRFDALPDWLVGQGALPTVLYGRSEGVGRRVGRVMTDDLEGAYAMASHLHASGRRRITVISGPSDSPTGKDRLEGYRAALTEVGTAIDDHLVENGDYTRAGGRAAMHRLLARVTDLDAVLVACDHMAEGAIEALHEEGRSVPRDVAVGGFDDSVSAARPRLTTISHPWNRIGEEMARLLLSMMADQPPSSVILPSRLVRRLST